MNVLRRLFLKSNKKWKSGSGFKRQDWGERHPRTGWTSVPREWAELRNHHYQNWFGGPEDVLIWHEFISPTPHVDIYVYPPSSELGRDYFTFVTSGMSDSRMKLPRNIDPSLGRAEIIYYIDPGNTPFDRIEKPWYAQAMSFFAHYPFDYHTWLGISHTVTNGNPPVPVVEGSQLTTALFLPPVFESQAFTNGLLLSGEKINYLWLIFITDDECNYLQKFGFDALFHQLKQHGLMAMLNPNRSSLVPR